MKLKSGHSVKSNGTLGKIRSLPSAIREEVNRRLEDGQIAREIADWLNTLEEVRKVMAEKWDGQPVEQCAVFSWRKRGYEAWRRRREHLDQLRDLAEYSLKLGQAAGGSIADGSAAIAGGRIMSLLEAASDEDLLKMVRPINELRAGDFTKARIRQGDKKLEQLEQRIELERQRFQRDSAQLFIKWYGDQKARDIVESRANNAEKIERLGRAMFGDTWRC